jgi:hypothetical protein
MGELAMPVVHRILPEQAATEHVPQFGVAAHQLELHRDAACRVGRQARRSDESKRLGHQRERARELVLLVWVERPIELPHLLGDDAQLLVELRLVAQEDRDLRGEQQVGIGDVTAQGGVTRLEAVGFQTGQCKGTAGERGICHLYNIL